MTIKKTSYIIYDVRTGKVVFSSDASWIVEEVYKSYRDLGGVYQKKEIII